MSDFLSNLAATTLQVAPIAQPRMPALFEPRTLQSDASLIETTEVEAVSRQSPVETRRTERENVTRSNTVSRSKANALDSSSQTEVTMLRAELQPSTIATSSMSQTEPVVSAAPWPNVESSGREEQSGRAGAARSVVEDISSQVSTSPLAPRTSSREISQPGINRQSIETRLASEPIEPRIHISIGRIEVRAITAPAPTRAARRDASVLGLDDYLRQRR